MKRFILLLLTFVIASNTMDAKFIDLLPRAKFATKLDAKGFRLSRAIQIADGSNTLILKDFFTEHGCTIKPNARAKVVVNLTDRIEDTEDYYLAGYENEAYRLTIHPNTIEIKAVSPVGVIRATQTLEMLAEAMAPRHASKRLTLSTILLSNYEDSCTMWGGRSSLSMS